MQKRGVPFTPEPAANKIGRDVHKKQREYNSPLATNNSPLRNVLPRGRDGMIAEMHQNSTPTRLTPLNDDLRERRDHRVKLVEGRRELKKALLSPAPRNSPKAKPISQLNNSNNNLKHSTASPLSTIKPESRTIPLPSTELTSEQRNKIFEEWMKIAADNKINAKNSWNVALIDYFSELTFLRDGDSINFQKASCTLDGCVKIYSTRVDSVADETGKLLNGLADGKNSKFMFTENNDDGNIELGLKESMTEVTKTSSRRPHKLVDTLEKSFEALNLKNFELEFSVDPLFKKMCAEFDESGSNGGLLSSNLNFSTDGRLLLDLTEECILEETDDNNEDNSECDISMLISSFGKKLVDLGNMDICPSLKSFSFEKAEGTALTSFEKELINTLKSVDITEMDLEEMESNLRVEEDLDDISDLDLDGRVTVPFMDEMYDDDLPIPSEEQLNEETAAIASSFAPSNHSIETTSMELGFGSESNSSFLAYFDSHLAKNWAGPQHWKINRAHIRRQVYGSSSDATATQKTRPQKKQFTLDFNADPIDISTLFVKANPVSITLSKTMLDERREKDNLLPEDVHFSSTALLKLFIDPSWTVGKRAIKTTRQVYSEENTITTKDRPDLENNEVEPSFWADPTNVTTENTLNNSFEMNIPNDYDDDGYVPSFDQNTNDIATNSIELHNLTKDDLVPTFRRDLTIDLSYTRKAKKVDVQELKQALWTGLTVNKTATEHSPTITFTSLINTLDGASLSRDTLQDASVPYCFICLLHLANEHDLEISPTPDSSDFVISN